MSLNKQSTKYNSLCFLCSPIPLRLSTFYFERSGLFTFSSLILSNSTLQFCLQNYYKKSECANKIHFILPFAGFCERNLGGNVVAESEITTKNPNVQIKFILFCSLLDYTAFFVGASIQSRDHIETTSRPV